MPVRIGVLGAGGYAQRAHLPQLARHPDAVLHAVCRRNPVRLAEVADRYQIPHRYAGIPEALADPELDAVTISLPHSQHYAVARAALARGLHVMVDKPMALATAEARDLIDLARAQQRVLMVGFNRHYEPPFTRAKRELDAGTIGRPRLLDCYLAYDWNYWRATGDARFAGEHAYVRATTPPEQLAAIMESTFRGDAEANGGGYFADGGAHFVDACLWLTGAPARQVFAVMDSADYDLYAAVTLTLADGTICCITCVGDAPEQRDFRFSIYAEGGAMHLRWAELVIHRTGERPQVLTNDQMPFEGSHVENFVDVILGRATPRATAEDGLRQVAVTEAAYRSAREGRPVEL